MIRAALAVLFALSSCACASQSMLRSDAYYNERYAYRVGYVAPGQLASADWTLDNFKLDDKGQATSPKSGPEYRGDFHADLDGDGTLERADEIDLYDLRFIHRKTAALLWLSSIPLSQTHGETDLTVLARAFVDAVSGAGLRVEQIGDGVIAKQRTYATRILDQKPIRIDDAPAHRITFEMASVDQLELDPQSRWQRVTVVLIRPGFFWSPQSAQRTQQLFPVLLVAGYESQPDQFETGIGEFEALLQRIAFVPAEFAADAPDVIACAGGKHPIRLVVTKSAVISPDLPTEQLGCVRKLLEDRHWPLNSMHKSFVFRAKDASR